jgi:hypothetical protein
MHVSIRVTIIISIEFFGTGQYENSCPERSGANPRMKIPAR